MNVLEKAEKALEFLKNNEGTAKSHELHAAVGTLGRCLGALGCRPNCARHYANLLHSAITTLLSLASNTSAEVRLVGDEALNRVVAGGFAFHCHKTNIILQNQVELNKNGRWIRAILSRICLGENWLRPGPGKIRSQAQTLFPKLSEVVRQTSEIQLIVEALEANLPRILNALAEYTMDEEIADLTKSLLSHVESTEPAVRRGISACVAHLCSHRELLLTDILAKVFDKLWPVSSENATVMGWFCVIKAIFQINEFAKFTENDLFSVQDFLELYQLCLHYIEHTASDHNIQNGVLECLTVLLSQAKGEYRRVLTEKHPILISLDDRNIGKGHRRNISSTSVISTRYIPSPAMSEHREQLEISFRGELQLGSILQLNTPSLSVDDLSIQTPDSPVSEADINLPNAEELSKDLVEKLQEYEEEQNSEGGDQIDQAADVCTSRLDDEVQINIGSNADDTVPLQYCSRLIVSKYLLAGNKGDLLSDRFVRVSVKSSALNCFSEILKMYPQAITLYLDKDADNKTHNVSGSSENTDSNPEHVNDFILERNVCYQESLSDSLTQDLLNRSFDSHLLPLLKKDSKSLEKSQESVEQKSSSKDVQSAILDSKVYAKNDLVASEMSIDSNPVMTTSNFTSNSNMTGSNDPTSGYPMTSSGDILTSSVDLDMKFDHFGESTTNLDNLDAFKDLEIKEDGQKRVLRRPEVNRDMPDIMLESFAKSEDNMDVPKNFECQHMSDVFVLLECHNDPQVRGLVRVCIGNYLAAALDISHGDYHKWKEFCGLPKDVSDNLRTEKLVAIVLKGLSDEIHSTVNHTLSSLTHMTPSLCNSVHWLLVADALNALINVENNGYWLCKVNLCKLYEKLPFQKLFMLYNNYRQRSTSIMGSLIRLLGDQDQKVRSAASQAIANIIPKIYPSRRDSPNTMVLEIAKNDSKLFNFDHKELSLSLVREMYFYSDVPKQMRNGQPTQGDTLTVVVADLMSKLMTSSCKHQSQGLMETLREICRKYPPWHNKEAYRSQGILAYCLDNLDYCNGSVAAKTIMLDLCSFIYPVEIDNIMINSKNKDIFERDSQSSTEKWFHLESEKMASHAEKFLNITLKMLNVLDYLIEEINPNVHLNKGEISFPGSPVRRKTQDSVQRKSGSQENVEEKSTLRKKLPIGNSAKLNFAGCFYNEPPYMKFYESLRATYSNHKINLDPKSSMFHAFLSTILNCLAVQLELATEKEIGHLTEEILYYLKIIMPYCPDSTVYCVTQLLKCLFGTNMVNQYSDFISISDKIQQNTKKCFYQDVMLINDLTLPDDEDKRSSISSNTSQKLALDIKNPKLTAERLLLISMENFSKNKTDRKWITNKKELERYIRLFEPVVIQSLKSYTMQNDIPLQCSVLGLLNQLLALRVNYCMLDSEQVFIGFLLKQLDLVEQHEIPNCCDLVNGILTFLVQLSSSKHHTKQIIEIPKLIQLCDGLMASGAHAECISGLEPVAVKVFSNMGGTTVLGRAQQQDAQATREVLFYMLQKTMHQPKVLDLVSCVLSLSQEHPESYYRWSELASDTLLNLLSQRSVEIDSSAAISSLERLLDSVYRDVLLDQSRVEMVLKILFKAPPDQTTTPYKLKIRYLSIIMVLLRKILILVPENEILLSINYLKATFISPQSIFFNVKLDTDPLNVQNVNENCANLSPDVVLVRFLFKTLTYAIAEVGSCYDSCAIELNDNDVLKNDSLLYAVCVNIIVQVKHMLHLSNGCLFPLTAKTAQTLLHNEQSGLNTGLYSPEENIPLDLLNLICLKSAHRTPLLTVHWSHLLIRLNFLSHKYWQKLIGYARNLPLSSHSGDTQLLCANVLQIACVMAYCEYFVENGLSEAVHLTWLLVNRVHILVHQYQSEIVQSLIKRVQQNAGASGLLLQAVAARCQSCLKDEFALNTYKILSLCHENQSGALVFLICRIIGKLEPAIGVRFAKLAVARCKMLKDMPVEKILVQLAKEDVQVALELLQRDKVHIRYSSLVQELNSLASSVFDLSPLDLSQDRAINPQHIVTTKVDANWFLNQVKSRCCLSDSTFPIVPKQKELALLLLKLSKEDLITLMHCPEFDRKLLNACFKVSCDSFLREFLNNLSSFETREMERDSIREQREMAKLKEEMSGDTNKLNVVNSLHMFKKNEKSDNKESKSQFFITRDRVGEEKENFGNLEFSDDDFELNLPVLPDLYQASVATFDECLTEIARLFPKQNRPLSQSENFDLNAELTIDRYTKRCHQVFQDKLFYQEFMAMQTVLTGYLEALDRIIATVDEADCNLLDKSIGNLLPASLAKNIAVFSVISLQYLSFLIKNKRIVESTVPSDVSFRVNATVTDNIVVDNVIRVVLENVSDALSFDEIFAELNNDCNMNRTQSAICCLYAVVKYLVKDTRPLVLKKIMNIQDTGPQPDLIITGDKLLTLLDYWERQLNDERTKVIRKCLRKPVQSLIVSLSRLDIVCNIALIPPIAWSSVEVAMKGNQIQKINLPLQTLQDMDVLEAFLFRVHLIGWSSKKQFEEIWVGLLGALQGNGTHWAVRGISELLVNTAPRIRRRGLLHVPRDNHHVANGMQRLRNILLGTSAYKIFDSVNLERVPLINDGITGFLDAQFSIEYLRMASEISDQASYKVRQHIKRIKKSTDIDVNSCLQFLMDVTTQMLEPKACTGSAGRAAVVRAVGAVCAGGALRAAAPWARAARRLLAPHHPHHPAPTHLLPHLALCVAALHAPRPELSTVHQKLLKSLTSSSAPLRQAALHGCLLQLFAESRVQGIQAATHPCHDLVSQLNVTVRQQLANSSKISLYEQSLCWSVLFTLIQLGHPDLINVAVNFFLRNPKHYCVDLVVRGILMTIKQQLLPKDLKNTIIERLLENMKCYSEDHAVQIMLVHLFTADNKLLSPKLATDVSNMDPDVLMSSMERVTILYKMLRHCKKEENKEVVASTLKYFLRETLPPAATLSRVVIEFLECCKEAEKIETGILNDRDRWIDCSVLNAEIVFEVFETAVSQEQLPVLTGWLFEALCHLLTGKISTILLPYCALTLLVSSSANEHIRNISPQCYHILKVGFHKSVDGKLGSFGEYLKRSKDKMSFSDRRLLCVVSMHSDFNRSQLDRLQELCDGNECLSDVLQCLNI